MSSSARFCVAALLMVAACACATAPATTPSASASPPRAAATLAPASPGPALRGTISTSGDYSLNATFTVHAVVDVHGLTSPAPTGSSCAQYAQGLASPGQVSASFTAPEIQTAGDHTLYLRASLDTGYTGPGTYTTASARSLQGNAIVGVPQSGGPAFTVYNSRISGTTTLTVNRDGSGMLRFEEWGDDENRGGNIAGNLSGTVSWVCL